MIVNISGKEVLIDDNDAEKIATKTWHVSSNGYVVNRSRCAKTLRVTIYLHRFILDYNGPLMIDHINHNKLDNRKENLRVTTSGQNQLNRTTSLQPNNSSGHVGVSFNPRQGWTAYIQRCGKKKSLGTFSTRDEAIKARKEAEGKI